MRSLETPTLLGHVEWESDSLFRSFIARRHNHLFWYCSYVGVWNHNLYYCSESWLWYHILLWYTIAFLWDIDTFVLWLEAKIILNISSTDLLHIIKLLSTKLILHNNRLYHRMYRHSMERAICDPSKILAFLKSRVDHLLHETPWDRLLEMSKWYE